MLPSWQSFGPLACKHHSAFSSAVAMRFLLVHTQAKPTQLAQPTHYESNSYNKKHATISPARHQRGKRPAYFALNITEPSCVGTRQTSRSLAPGP